MSALEDHTMLWQVIRAKINTAGSFATSNPGPIYDVYRRAWNDVKSALRHAKLCKTFLSMSVVFNLKYGPGGTGG